MRPSDGPPSTKPCGSAPASRRSLSPSSLSPPEVSPSEPSPSPLSPSGLESPWLSSTPESSNSIATSAEWPGVDRLSTAGRPRTRDPSAEIRLPRSVSHGSTAAFLFVPDAFAATLFLATGGFAWRCSCSDASSDTRAGGTSSEEEEEEHAMVCRRTSFNSFGLASFASRSSSGICACKSSTAQQSHTQYTRCELA